MDARLGPAALLLSVGLLTGCASPAAHDDAIGESTQTVPVGDPAYAMSALRRAPEGDFGVLPATLAESLPNHHLALGETGRTSSFSDAVVVGRLTDVVKGQGVVWRDDHDFTVVSYDDPRADTRSVYLTVAADVAVGTIRAPTVVFRVVVPAHADPQRFVEGLAGLRRVAVVLSHDPNRAEAVPWRPILNDGLIAVVAEDGSLTLPGLRHGMRFAGDIHTVAQLLTAAHRPGTTTTVGVP